MLSRLLFAALLCLHLLPATALDLSELSNRDAGRGLREALNQGIGAAVGQLAQQNGFLNNPKVKIPLPGALAKAEPTLRTLGLGRYADELSSTLNQAAELAVTEAKPILIDSVKKMTLTDAKNILTGPDDAATQFFRKTSSEAIAKKFLPKVQAATAKVQLAEHYNRFAGSAVQYRLIDAADANLDQYVTRKAMDGLFLLIAEQEKAIRQDPAGQASALLKTVFGAALQ